VLVLEPPTFQRTLIQTQWAGAVRRLPIFASEWNALTLNGTRLGERSALPRRNRRDVAERAADQDQAGL
jgi:hypothetical protein